MKIFVVAAMGAVLLSGCAPFEHGHYSNDVSYRNTVGDPPGTPLVYRQDDASTRLAGHPSALNKPSSPWSADRYHSGAINTAYVPTAPVAAQSYIQSALPAPVAQASYALPTTYVQPQVQQAYVAPTTYVQQPVQQAYVAPTYTQPVAQSYVAQQTYIQPALQSTYAAAPVQQHSNVLATSYGGPRLDADGYAICDIPFSGHTAYQTPQYQARF